MNNLVFAGALADYTSAADNLNRHFKIFVPSRGGQLTADGAAVRFDSGKIITADGGRPLSVSGTDGTVLCIEQPLLPAVPQIIDEAPNSGFKHIAAQAMHYFASGGDPAVAAALGQLAVAYISSGLTKPARQPVVDAVIADVNKNFTDSTYSVEAFIAKLPLNYDYVRKLFKRQVGMSPHAYLTGLRMNRARDILLSGVTNRYSNYTISQVAEACGYAEPLYFSRVFKQHFGVSPLQYAKDNDRK